MALARLGGSRRPENYTWPGFVDALATLLMVIIFVLLVFVLIQVNLAYRVSGQDATMNDMRAEIASLGDLLNLEKKANADLADELASISSQLLATSRERDTLSLQLAASRSERDRIAAQLADAASALGVSEEEIARLTSLQQETDAALRAARGDLEARSARLAEIEGRLAESAAALTETQTSLISAEANLAETENRLNDAAGRNVTAMARISELETENAASRQEVAQMTNAVTALRLRIEELTSLLAEKEAEAARDKVAIASLGKSLNNALASRVQELQQFRSEFFGRLRDVLRGRDDVRIVGDRFVFQSEVLFNQGQADIGPEGQQQLGQLFCTMRIVGGQRVMSVRSSGARGDEPEARLCDAPACRLSWRCAAQLPAARIRAVHNGSARLEALSLPTQHNRHGSVECAAWQCDPVERATREVSMICTRRMNRLGRIDMCTVVPYE